MDLITGDSFTSTVQIDRFMAQFGVVLKQYPPLPVTTGALIAFMQAIGVPRPALQRCLAHIKRGHNLFNPADRPHPGSHSWPASLADELFWAQPHRFIDHATPIVSMGSCFAVEIAQWLQENGYNYVVTESDPNHTPQKSSAQWGLLYSSANVKQVVEWAFGEDTPPIAPCPWGDTLPHGALHKNRWTDLFRCDVLYDENSVKHIEMAWQRHLMGSRAALQACKVLVVTVGLNEVFRWLPTGHYTHRTPTRINPGLWQEEVLTVQQNVDFLTRAVATLRKYNPGVKVIATVSPVPLNKTFRRDTHVVCATAYSKSVLRVALEQLSQTVEDFYYMASYETVMYPGQGTEVWQADGRHVEREIVGKIMRLFERQFCVGAQDS